MGLGSAVQLTTFGASKEFLIDHQIVSHEYPLTITFIAGMMSGLVSTVCTTPFDVIRTRLYNQGLDKSGQGILYNGIWDCLVKIWKSEGFLGLFKGFGPCYLRIGPHSLLVFLFWDALKAVEDMEYVAGAMAGVVAGFFTNPLDVVKTGLQLQGELEAKGTETIRYRNTLHAFYTIARHDGLLSLQKGLVPALWFQVFLNGTRLGAYATMEEWNWTKNKDGSVNFVKTLNASILSGCLGSYVGSPFYLVKTHLQSQGGQETAVGYQHKHTGSWSALKKIYSRDGLRGLWRGSISSLPRMGVGSAAQLATFSLAKEFIIEKKIIQEEKRLTIAFWASMLSGVVVAIFMTPFDVIQTRLYNQGVDAQGKGILYKGIADCFAKTFRYEGIQGLFKGIGPCYFRVGPHTLLSLMSWDFFRDNLKYLKN